MRISFITFATCVGHCTRSSPSPPQAHAPPRSLSHNAPRDTESKEDAHQQPTRQQKPRLTARHNRRITPKPHLPTPGSPGETRPSLQSFSISTAAFLHSKPTSTAHKISAAPLLSLQTNHRLHPHHPASHPRNQSDHQGCSITPSRTTASIAS
jgi:hypothetical protein